MPLLEVGLPGVGPVWIHRCDGCGMRQVRPRLGAAALDALYGADYFDSQSAHGFAGYARQRQRYDRDAFFLARELRRLASTGRFLEVGSALGFLLASLEPQTGWEVEGVELSAFGAWYARNRFGVRVHRGTLEDAGLPAATFDYVLQKDLLEHVPHPRRHLEETRRIMRPGAHLRVITPNGEADVRPMRRAAAELGPDALPSLWQGHLSFFSREQLLRLLGDVGFRVLRVRSIGIRRGLRALGTIPGRSSRTGVMRRSELAARRPSGATGGAGVAPWGREEVAAARPEPLLTSGGSPAAVTSREEVATAGPEPREEQAARIDAEIAVHHRRVRAWRLYFHYRRLVKRLDALPGALAFGQDFDLLVEKR